MKSSHWLAVAMLGMPFLINAQDVQITHPPYLTMPSENGVAIGWGTDKPSGAEVMLREVGADSYQRHSNATGGQIPHHNTLHRVHVEGLKPGTAYEYQLVNHIPTKPERAYGEAYAETVQDTVWRFTTMNPAKKTCRAVICTDIHSDAKRMVQTLELGGMASADVAISLGDTSEYLVDAEKSVFGGYLTAVGAYLNGAKPLVVLRGNHDWRGAQSLRWLDFLGTSDKNAYFAFAQGPVFFIQLDSGEDKPDQKTGSAYTYFNRSDAYMKQQRNWLERTVQTEAFRNAKYRIVLTHIATHGQGNSYPSVRMKETFADLLNRIEPERRIHLMLSGHTHSDMRFNAGSDTPNMGKMRRPMPAEFTGKNFHYPAVTLGNKSVMTLDVDADRLHCVTRKIDGSIIDTFDISPDFKLNDQGVQP